MADHSIGTRDEFHESEASEASVVCFDNASPEKSCFVDGLVWFISLCLPVFVFLNATRRDRNCSTFPLTESSGSMEFAETKEVSRRSPRELKFVRYILRLADLTNQLNDELMWCLVVFQHDCMANTSHKVKKSYSWETSSVSKEEVVYLRLHFTKTESHDANITVESASEWTSTTPIV